MMRPEIGRYLENHNAAVVKLVRVLYDLGMGAGHDVEVSVEGREIVFGRRDASLRGFMRVTAFDGGAALAFPAGHQLFDPERRAKGARGSEARLTLFDATDVDAYVRRMIAAAYALEEPASESLF